jgi:hypothetical protein
LTWHVNVKVYTLLYVGLRLWTYCLYTLLVNGWFHIWSKGEELTSLNSHSPRAVEDNGFKQSSNDVELPTKGLEKHISSMWRKLSMCLLLWVVIGPWNLGFKFGFHGDKKPISCLLGLMITQCIKFRQSGAKVTKLCWIMPKLWIFAKIMSKLSNFIKVMSSYVNL